MIEKFYMIHGKSHFLLICCVCVVLSSSTSTNRSPKQVYIMWEYLSYVATQCGSIDDSYSTTDVVDSTSSASPTTMSTEAAITTNADTTDIAVVDSTNTVSDNTTTITVVVHSDENNDTTTQSMNNNNDVMGSIAVALSCLSITVSLVTMGIVSQRRQIAPHPPSTDISKL